MVIYHVMNNFIFLSFLYEDLPVDLWLSSVTLLGDLQKRREMEGMEGKEGFRSENLKTRFQALIIAYFLRILRKTSTNPLWD